jgi:hypothetical protein
VRHPTVNGSLETVEKQSRTRVNAGYREDTTTHRREATAAAVRQTTELTREGQQASDRKAEYELNANGRLQRHRQTVTKTVTGADGSKDRVVDIFEDYSGPGQAKAANDPEDRPNNTSAKR